MQVGLSSHTQTHKCANAHAEKGVTWGGGRTRVRQRAATAVELLVHHLILTTLPPSAHPASMHSTCFAWQSSSGT